MEVRTERESLEQRLKDCEEEKARLSESIETQKNEVESAKK